MYINSSLRDQTPCVDVKDVIRGVRRRTGANDKNDIACFNLFLSNLEVVVPWGSNIGGGNMVANMVEGIRMVGIMSWGSNNGWGSFYFDFSGEGFYFNGGSDGMGNGVGNWGWVSVDSGLSHNSGLGNNCGLDHVVRDSPDLLEGRVGNSLGL